MHTFESFGVSFKNLSINGIDFFSFEKTGTPIFVSVFFHAGSKFNDIDGTAHFLEHMLVAGSEKFPSKNLLADYIENTGGRFSASTNSDFIRLDLEVAEQQDVPILVDILDQMINKSLFTTDVFEMERNSILAELAGKKSHQREFIWEVYQKVFFQKTVLAKTNLGTEDSIRATSLDDVRAFKDNYFSRGKVSVVMAGGLNTQKLCEDLSKVLGDKRDAEINTEKVSIVRDAWFDTELYPSKLASIAFGFRTFAKSLKDEVCAKLCSDYLAGSRASKLITKLRYEKGLVYSISTANRLLQNGSVLAVRTDCAVENLPQVLQIISESFQDLHENGIAPEKLKKIKSRVLKSFLIELQTSKSWVVNNDRLAIVTDKKSVVDLLSVINEVSTEDIKKYSQDNFLKNKAYLAMCGPESASEIIKKFGSTF